MRLTNACDDGDALSDLYHCCHNSNNNNINNRVTVDKLNELDCSLTRVLSKVRTVCTGVAVVVLSYRYCGRWIFCHCHCTLLSIIMHPSIHLYIYPFTIHSSIHLSIHPFYPSISLSHYSDTTQKKRRGVMKDFLQDCAPTPITQIGDPNAAPFGRVDTPDPSLLSVKQYVQSLGRGQYVQSSTQAQVYGCPDIHDLSNLFSCNS